MTRAQNILNKSEKKEEIKTFDFWVDKSDEKEAMRIMLASGLAKGDIESSVRKEKGKKVWTITSTDMQVSDLQNDLAKKDINSWVDEE